MQVLVIKAKAFGASCGTHSLMGIYAGLEKSTQAPYEVAVAYISEFLELRVYT